MSPTARDFVLVIAVDVAVIILSGLALWLYLGRP